MLKKNLEKNFLTGQLLNIFSQLDHRKFLPLFLFDFVQQVPKLFSSYPSASIFEFQLILVEIIAFIDGFKAILIKSWDWIRPPSLCLEKSRLIWLSGIKH